MAPALIAAPTSLADKQWLFSEAELASPPSVRAGDKHFTLARERFMRAEVVRKLWQLYNGIQGYELVVGTASTFMHRFYMRETFQDFDVKVMTATAYFLASKVEEHQRSLNTVIAATLNRGRAMRDKDNRIRGFDPQAPQVVDFRNKVLHCEETMLRTLCFDLTVRLPYPAMMNGVKRMWKGEEQEFITKVSRAAWHFISDSLSSILVLVHRPNVIAAASIVCATEQLEIPLSTAPKAGDADAEEPHWLELFDVKAEEVQDAVKRMMEVYKHGVDVFVREEAGKLAPKVISAASHLEPPPIPSAPALPAAPTPTPPADVAALNTPPVEAAAPTARSPPPPPPPLPRAVDPILSDMLALPGDPTPPPPPASLPFPPPPPAASSAASHAAVEQPLVDPHPLDRPPPPPPPPAPFNVEGVSEERIGEDPMSLKRPFAEFGEAAQLGPGEGHGSEGKRMKLEGEA